MAKQVQEFRTEIKQLLDLMINSLYSHKEIFLRELISNSSDAIDRLRFEAKTNPDLHIDSDELEIRLIPDSAQGTLTVVDNGIGMSYDEVVENIGTIAHSGTKEFIRVSEELKQRPELIGQFGVGFYSSFMVADRVILHTQRAGAKDGVLWESAGDGSYSIDQVPRPGGRGTTITLYLKKKSEKDGDDAHEQDFTSEWELRSLVRKYSDFIAAPIRMKVKKQVPKKDDKDKFEEVIEDEILNSRKPLWLRPTSEIKEEEYADFYHHQTHDWGKPLKTIHFKAEGTIEYTALLFVPENKPWDFHVRGTKYGLNLYVRRVFIMSDCDSLIPSYLRFVRGLVDSNDLSLNISREILQQDRQVKQIHKSLTGKILNSFKETLEKEREQYEKMWHAFGATLKEGIATDPGNSEKLQDLFLFHSTDSDKLTTLAEYVGRMKDQQNAIYYITGDNLAQIKNSPYLERLREKGFEVLLLVDPVDEWVVDHLTTYREKELQSITRENLDLDSLATAEEKKQKEEILNAQKDRLNSLLEKMKEFLKDKVKDVRVSTRLAGSPVCLVSGQHDPSARMERLMREIGGAAAETRRIMEINPAHPLFEKMTSLPEEVQKDFTKMLFAQALLLEGGAVPDPVEFSRQISELMVRASK